MTKSNILVKISELNMEKYTGESHLSGRIRSQPGGRINEPTGLISHLSINGNWICPYRAYRQPARLMRQPYNKKRINETRL